MDNPAGNKPFRVLAVCTGNICRSPTVELLLAELLGVEAGDAGGTGPEGAVVSSAGTGALTGEPIDPLMAALLAARRIRVNGHRARQATPPLLREADLVLTATREHRVWVITEMPSLLRRTFTVREFGRIAALVAAEGDVGVLSERTAVGRLRALAGRAADLRRQVRSADYSDDDIVDPYRRGAEAAQTALAQIDEAMGSLATLLWSAQVPVSVASAPTSVTGRMPGWRRGGPGALFAPPRPGAVPGEVGPEVARYGRRYGNVVPVAPPADVEPEVPRAGHGFGRPFPGRSAARR